MANAPSAIPMSVPPPWSASAMNAHSETSKTNVSSAVGRESQMHSTALNVHAWRKIEMDVQKLSIWARRGRICSTKRRTSGTNNSFKAMPTSAGQANLDMRHGVDLLLRLSIIATFNEIKLDAARLQAHMIFEYGIHWDKFSKRVTASDIDSNT